MISDETRPAGAPRRRWRRVLVPALLAVALSGCSFDFENNPGITQQAKTTHNLFVGFDAAALLVGALVWGLIGWCVIWYRRKSPDHMPKQTRYNVPWEVVYTVTPVLAVGVLFGYTIVSENSVDKVSTHPDQVVNITAFQWGWKFDYVMPGGHDAVVTTDPNNFAHMELPLGQTTRVNLRSADVVHEFLVSQFNFQRYAQPGVTNTFDLTPTQTGTFRGRCNFFCGLHHDLMVFYVDIVPPDQFQSWLTKTAAQTAKANSA